MGGIRVAVLHKFAREFSAPGHGSPAAFLALQSAMAAFSRAIPFLPSSIALSHPLKFFLDNLSRLLIVFLMVDSSFDYRRAYEKAQQELADLLSQQEQHGKRIVLVRKSLQTLKTLAESEGVAISPSADAAYLLENLTLADDIRNILKARYPDWLRPHEVKGELEQLGHDLSEYGNPQATIHMVLKRMVKSEEVYEGNTPEQGKKTYQWIQRSRGLRSAPFVRKAKK